MSLSYPSYSTRDQQGHDEPTRTPLNRSLPGTPVSNVRAASASLLANRMDALSMQVGRVACYGLE